MIEWRPALLKRKYFWPLEMLNLQKYRAMNKA